MCSQHILERRSGSLLSTELSEERFSHQQQLHLVSEDTGQPPPLHSLRQKEGLVQPSTETASSKTWRSRSQNVPVEQGQSWLPRPASSEICRCWAVISAGNVSLSNGCILTECSHLRGAFSNSTLLTAIPVRHCSRSGAPPFG